MYSWESCLVFLTFPYPDPALKKLCDFYWLLLPITCKLWSSTGFNFRPFVFNYINDLPGCLLHTKAHMYADDTTIYVSSVSTAELYAKVNNDLTRVRDWLLANKLSLNFTKTEYMFLRATFKLYNLGRDFPIKIGNNHVKRVQTTKYLGIHLDENLKWNEHVDKLC